MKLDALRINKNCKYLATVKIDVSELSKGGNSQGYIVIVDMVPFIVLVLKRRLMVVGYE